MADNKKSYFAVIPANVRYDEDLPPNAKLLYGEITALCNNDGFCWASNKYFADLYGVSTISISKWISALARRGYISSKLVYKDGTKQIDKRYITILCDPLKQKFNTPVKEMFKENNTSLNNTFNNTDEYRDVADKPPKPKEPKEPKKRKLFVPPTLEEVKVYCKERRNKVNAKDFYDYYSTSEPPWHDSNGKEVRSWKQKVITWESHDKKDKPKSVPQGTGNPFLGMMEDEE